MLNFMLSSLFKVLKNFPLFVIFTNFQKSASLITNSKNQPHHYLFLGPIYKSMFGWMLYDCYTCVDLRGYGIENSHFDLNFLIYLMMAQPKKKLAQRSTRGQWQPHFNPMSTNCSLSQESTRFKFVVRIMMNKYFNLSPVQCL